MPNHLSRATALLVCVLSLSSLLTGCKRSDRAAAPASPTPAGQVLLVGLDAADLEIVNRLASAGRLPTFSRLMREGVAGELRSEEPLISPVVWTTIATGRSPLDHRIIGFLTSRDGVTEPVRSDERQVRAFWNVASDAGASVGVLGWYATWPAEKVNGFLVSDRVGAHQVEGQGGSAPVKGLVYPDSLMPEIAALQSAVSKEVDEAAATKFFERGATPAGQPIRVPETKLKEFVNTLRTTELYRRLWPQLWQKTNPTVGAVYFEGTDAVGHLFEEYAPPPRKGVSADDAAHFGQVFDRYYEYVDTILGEYLSHVDPAKTTVVIVSDHGFRTGDRRPPGSTISNYANEGPLWHRPEGLLMMWGRGVKRGAPVERATVYDVLPTVFRLAGLPLAQTLHGRPLDALLEPSVLAVPVKSVADYEAAGPREKTAAPAALPSEEEIARLRALGYVGGGANAPLATPGATGQEAIAVSLYNEAAILMNARRFAEALPIGERLKKMSGGEMFGWYTEGMCQLGLGHAQEAIAPLRKALELRPNLARIWGYLGEAQFEAGQREEAEKTLKHALALDPALGRPALILGQRMINQRNVAAAKDLLTRAKRNADGVLDEANACVGLAVIAEEERQIDRAVAEYEEALHLVPAHAVALERYANLSLFLDKPQQAVALLERLVAARSGSPRAYMLYGRALAAAGRRDDARAALRRSLEIDPKQADVRQMLAQM